MTDKILILDFGSQVTQLIARRVRENGVYSEIHPYTMSAEAIRAFSPKGIILSGGPASVTQATTPRAPDIVFTMGVPVLAICYGMQTMCFQLGGGVRPSDSQEFGRATIDIVGDSPLFEGLWPKGSRAEVWMSHGDKIDAIPAAFRVVAATGSAPYAAIADDKRRFYGVLFHPEVVHTPQGGALLRNFTQRICGCSGDWTMAAFRSQAVQRIRDQVAGGRVVCGLSGGVDSAVAAALIHEAIGERLTCIFVDTGLLRLGEAEEVVRLFRGHYNIPLIHNDAGSLFLGKLAGVTDPEQKRRIIGSAFIDVFDADAKQIGDVDFLAQGTLYPDVIESVSDRRPQRHHQVSPQCRRAASAYEAEASRAVTRTVQGRGAGTGPRTRPARAFCRAPPVSRPGPGDPHPRRGDAGARANPSARRRGLPRRNPQGRALQRDLAGLRSAAAGQDRRRHGRRAFLRQCLRPARGDLDRRHDRRLLPIPARGARPYRDPDHQRGARDQPRRLRRDLKTAGHDRVGVRGMGYSGALWRGIA